MQGSYASLEYLRTTDVGKANESELLVSRRMFLSQGRGDYFIIHYSLFLKYSFF